MLIFRKNYYRVKLLYDITYNIHVTITTLFIIISELLTNDVKLKRTTGC